MTATNKIYDILDTSWLYFEGDFEAQIKEVLDFIRMSKGEVERLQLLFNDLQEIFGNRWKGSQLEIFGSIVTGLALRSSDVDCLVSLPMWLDEPSIIFVTEARRILQQNKKFKNVFAITKARIPIVQFTYTPTNTHCDVSFSTCAAVRNSKLLEYIIQSEERILPLTILVKYWSKIHRFTGKNLMSSYSLTLLFIFYLQQKNIIPSVLSLQQNIQEEIVDNWNTAFLAIINKSDNNENLYTLFGGFFKYYQNFNFSKYIISLYTGCLIEREMFMDLEKVPAEFKLYSINVRRKYHQPLRIDTVMCIQDPFDHCRNCGVSVHPKLAERIQNLFNKAAAIFENETESNFLRNLLYAEQIPQPKFKPMLKNVMAKKRGIKKSYKQQWNSMQIKQNAKNFKQQINRQRQYYVANSKNDTLP